MRLIIKNHEPAGWKEYRQTPGVVYQPLKCLRRALYKEQGGICAYCMQRLDDELKDDIVTTNRIEHIKCRDLYPDLQLDYQNMVICCKGESKENKTAYTYCDRKKKNQEIHFSPFDPLFIASLSYDRQKGKIVSSDFRWQNDMDKVLNLNNRLLMKNRVAVLKAIKVELGAQKWKSSQIKKMIELWNKRDAQGLYKPFCEMVVWYLKKKLTAHNIKV